MAKSAVDASVRTVAGHNLLIERSGRAVLRVPHIEFGAAACTLLVGPNGAGKSILVRTLCALQTPDSGRVTWNGAKPDWQRRHRVGLLLQRPVLLRRSALENVAFALRMSGLHRSAALKLARSTLQQAGLEAVGATAAQRLSGGEQQRLALARALALKPDMLFLDEATAHVDPASTQIIEQQLTQAMSSGLCVVMISHDMGQVRRLARSVVLMHNGCVIEHCDRQQFFDSPGNPITRSWVAGELLV